MIRLFVRSGSALLVLLSSFWIMSPPGAAAQGSTPQATYTGDAALLVPTADELPDWQQTAGTRSMWTLRSRVNIGQATSQYVESFEMPRTSRRVLFEAEMWDSTDVAAGAVATSLLPHDPQNPIPLPDDLTADDLAAGVLRGPGSTLAENAPFAVARARLTNVWLVLVVYDDPNADTGQVIDFLRVMLDHAHAAQWDAAPFDWDHAQPPVPRPWAALPAASDLPSTWQVSDTFHIWQDLPTTGTGRAGAEARFVQNREVPRIDLVAFDSVEAAVAGYATAAVPADGATSFPISGIGDQATGRTEPPPGPAWSRATVVLQRGALVADIRLDHLKDYETDDMARANLLQAAAAVDAKARAVQIAAASDYQTAGGQ